jgi:cytochrome c553
MSCGVRQPHHGPEAGVRMASHLSAQSAPDLVPLALCAAVFMSLGPAGFAGSTGSTNYDYLDGTTEQPWEVCAECHGVDGVSWSDRFPNIAGQNKTYLLLEMRHFRDGVRTNDDHQMAAVLSELSPATMKSIAAWYAAQPPAPPASPDLTPAEQAWAEGMVESGSGVLHGCDSCHGSADYHGIPMPRIDGERPGYLARQLRDFRDGQRADDPKGMMRRVVQQLTPGEIDVLARYLGGLLRREQTARR